MYTKCGQQVFFLSNAAHSNVILLKKTESKKSFKKQAEPAQSPKSVEISKNSKNLIKTNNK